MNRIFVILPVAIFAAFGAVAFFGLRLEDGQLPSTFVGKPAPFIIETALTGYEGIERENLGQGEVVLINFWASWCPPCRAEHGTLLALQERGITLLGVNYKDTTANARRYLQEDGNPFAAVAYDPQGKMGIEWGVTGPPETFIIGKDGKVFFRFQGALVASDYEQRFLPKLEEALAQ